jgi:membrane-bound ClpP family serine protease
MVIFATIFGIGFVILLLNLIFGADTDADFDTDGAEGPDVGGGPSIFSFKMASLLMVGFGAFGFGMRATTDVSMFWASMVGCGGALLVAIAGYVILRIFYTSQASSTITDRDIIGSDANLIDSIPANGNGQVACVVRGRECTFIARTSDGSTLDRGLPVRIVAKSGSIVTVVRAD